MEENVEKIVDRLILSGARVTEKGRLDFPDRLLFCPDETCRVENCVFQKLGIYLKSRGRLFEEDHVAIGKCKPTQLKDLVFPSLYSPLDNYREDYYEEKILPIILRLYEKECLEELFGIIQEK